MASERVKRRLSAILCADVVGYSSLMGEDETTTLLALKKCDAEVIEPIVKEHNGRIFKRMGDGFLIEFSSAVDSLDCALAWQYSLAERKYPLKFRIGINLGDVIPEDNDIYGHGVNIAARLEGLADPGGICISRSIYDQVNNKFDLKFEYLGEKAAKNISQPLKVYRVLDQIGTSKPRLTKKLEIPDKPSIAVLPFENMSIEPEQDFFCDGITEDIITGLASVPQLFVIARNSSFTYKGQHVKVQQLSQDLGVKYVLEGSVRRSKKQIRITAQLIDATTGNHLWASRYDRDLDDIFTLQDEITMKIITALQIKLTVGEQARLWSRRTNNLDAYLRCLNARSHFAHGKIEKYPIVRDISEEALEYDREYPVPYSLIAWTHYYDAKQGGAESREKSFRKAKEFALKTLELDDSFPDAHLLMGFIHLYERQFEEAVISGKRAINLSPNNAEAYVIMAHIQRFTGNFQEATNMAKKALRLQPHYPSFYLAELSMCHYYTGRYEDSVEVANEFLDLAENRGDSELIYFGHAMLAMNYIRLGNDHEAKNEAEKVMKLFPQYSLEWDRKASYYQYTEHLDQQHDDLRKAGIS